MLGRQKNYTSDLANSLAFGIGGLPRDLAVTRGLLGKHINGVWREPETRHVEIRADPWRPGERCNTWVGFWTSLPQERICVISGGKYFPNISPAKTSELDPQCVPNR